MNYKHIKFDTYDQVGVVVLNRPTNMNVLTLRPLMELMNVIEVSNQDSNIRSLLITGKDKVFSAGVDLNFCSEEIERESLEGLRDIVGQLHELILGMRALPKPIVAAVNGIASGGGFAIAVNSDIIYAADSARLNIGHARIALSPDGGLTAALSRIIGRPKLTELILTGRFIDAQEAFDLGIVNRIVSEDRLFDEAFAVAKDLAKGPETAFAKGKCLVDQAYCNTFESQLLLEEKAVLACMNAKDFKEAVIAFKQNKGA